MSISWDTLDEAIVVANLVMQRVMSAAVVAVIRPRARRACLGPYVMPARPPACYLIRKKLARIKFVLAGNNFGAIRLRRVLSRFAWLDRSGSRVIERGLGCRKISLRKKDGWTDKERASRIRAAKSYGIIKVRGDAFQIPLFSAALMSVEEREIVVRQKWKSVILVRCPDSSDVRRNRSSEVHGCLLALAGFFLGCQ